MSAASDKTDIHKTNQQFYDSLWADVRLVPPHRFNTWPLIKPLADAASQRLEVGPGMRPRLPVRGSHFVDISEPALKQLADAGGLCRQAPVNALPFADNSFELVCALDIIEHVEDDQGALAELCRVARPGATVLLSTPLHMDFWTPFDALVGHYRRYEPEQLASLLLQHRLTVMQSAGYGMKPRSSWLVDWAMRQMEKNRQRSMWFYNRLFMPIGLYFQKPLQWQQGMAATDGVNEVLLVCRLDKP
ncbi:MAG TPA: class I SAM-dependent methyltransferase [Pseudomonadales bacterium]